MMKNQRLTIDWLVESTLFRTILLNNSDREARPDDPRQRSHLSQQRHDQDFQQEFFDQQIARVVNGRRLEPLKRGGEDCSRRRESPCDGPDDRRNGVGARCHTPAQCQD